MLVHSLVGLQPTKSIENVLILFGDKLIKSPRLLAHYLIHGIQIYDKGEKSKKSNTSAEF